MILTKQELRSRIDRFVHKMNQDCPGWDYVFFLSHVNQYYFMGTMQDGLLTINKKGDICYFARRSYERAMDESPLSEYIYPMNSYRDVAKKIGENCGTAFFETEIVTLAILQRMQKYLKFECINSVDSIIGNVRAVKSHYELNCLKYTGKLHHDYLNNIVPNLFTEGMTETELWGKLYHSMLNHGHNGIARFSMFQSEMVLGQIGFGTSSLYPTNFDGPAGTKGLNAAVPFVGNRDIKLKLGDLVLVDCAYNVDGYHTDKTQIYCFKGSLPAEVTSTHKTCMEIQLKTASLMKPGASPSDIYETITNNLDPTFMNNFMGYQNRTVKFLGHGIGLYVDELPVIAKGFFAPLEKNMVIALEPKKGIENFGVVGVEDTFVVTENGGECITGYCSDIIQV